MTIDQDLLDMGVSEKWGWYRLVREMMIDLRAAGYTGTAPYVKEKFGGLRVQGVSLTDAQWAIARAAETNSFTICETCGEPGVERDMNDWLHTACEAHAKGFPPLGEEDTDEIGP